MEHKSVLFLALHRPDRSPSQRFRFEQYLQFLEEKNISYHFSYLLDEHDDKIYYSTGNIFKKAIIILKSIFKRFRELWSVKKYDYAFVQRESFMLGTSFFERQIAKRGVKLIYDFDDSIWIQNVSEANKKYAWLKDPDKTKKIIEAAHVVVAGNQYLADYALQFNKNVVIIPTTIDTNKYTLKENGDDSKVIIGWSGSVTTIPHFEMAVDFLKEIKRRYGDKVEFKVIGDKRYFHDELQIQGMDWNKTTEVDDLKEMDIGIMPLASDEWAHGKCGLKGLQYMALGVPALMSPVGVNTTIVKDGENGFLPGSHEEWVDKLSQLIDSKEMRKEMGLKGRKTVEQYYSVLANRDKFLSLFE